MKRPPKIVVDSNLLISAALAIQHERFTVLSYQLWDKIVTRDVISVASAQTLYELAGTLAHPRLRLSAPFIIDYVERITDAVDLVSILGLDMGCRDARDNIFIETAYNGRVDALVTRDSDLLDWRARYTLEKRACRVLGVTEFLASLSEHDKLASNLMVETKKGSCFSGRMEV